VEIALFENSKTESFFGGDGGKFFFERFGDGKEILTSASQIFRPRIFS
jgi:hypothetical protein